jgi:predicted amidohydrolase
VDTGGVSNATSSTSSTGSNSSGNPDPGPGRLSVALVQAASGLEPADNRAALDRLAPEGHELVVFPEAFARDFGDAGSDVSGYAEPLDGPFATEVARVADARGATVVAGMFERSPDPARPFNTLVARGGARVSYRKVHLYDSFGYRESDRLTAGPIAPVVVEVGGWQVGLMTCYDLRFPELARRLVDAGAELIVIPAAWVAGPRKVDHWRTLITARAIENTVYVAAVGQPAPRYTGHSMVVDPLGDVVAETGPGDAADPEVVTAELDRTALTEARRTNPSLANRRL